jgi:hypothetical protein
VDARSKKEGARMKKHHTTLDGEKNRPSLQSNFRRKFDGELMSFTNSAGEKTGAISTIGSKLNRR